MVVADRLAKLGVHRAAQDQGRAQDVRRRHCLAEKQGREDDGREGLEVAEDGDAGDGQAAHRREVEVAAKAGVEKADAQDGGHVEVGELGGGGQGQGAQAGVGQHVDGHDREAAAELDGRGLEAADVGDLLGEDDHQGIHDGAHAAERQAGRRDARAQALAHDQEGAQEHGREADELDRGEAGLEEDGRDGHHDDGAAVEEKRGHADADVVVGLEEEQPGGAQGRSGKGQVESLLGMSLGGEAVTVLAGEQDEAREKRRAEGDAGEYDEGAGQVDEVGDDAVGTKEHEGEQVLLGVFGHVARPSFYVVCIDDFDRGPARIKANVSHV